MNRAETFEKCIDLPDPWSDEVYSFPASFGQRTLWFVETLQPGRAVYNMPLPLRLVGKLDVAALEQSLNELVARHEALRTRLVADEAGDLAQQIAPSLPMTLALVDLSPVPPEERALALDALLGERGFRPFALDRGPLCRFELFRLAQEEHVLHVNVHHAVFDGHSHGLFLRELVALYEAFVKGEPSPLPEPALQYADFAHWQHEQFDGNAGAAALAFWRRQLSGAPPFLDLPTDAVRPKVLSAHGGHVETRLSQETNAALRAISESTGSTMFMVVLAAFLVVLQRYSGQQRIVVGTAVANRPQPELEEVIGFFVNMLPISVDLGGNPTFVELIRRVRDVALDAFAHQDTPFDLLVTELVTERDTSRTPIFQAVYSYQPRDAWPTLRMNSLEVSTLVAKEAPVKFELSFDVVEVEDGLGLAIDFSLDLWREATMARMLEHARVLIEAAARAPARRIANLPLLTEAERQDVLVAWNQTRTEYPRDTSIGALFSEVVRRQPDAIAVVHEDTLLSYAELERRANRFAWRLLERGVTKEEPIGVCLGRSPAFIVSVLGIIKAGAAYLPLDPTYPDERLSLMLKDAGARRILAMDTERGRFAATGCEVICAEDEFEHIVALPSGAHDADPRASPGRDALALVMYTSGSTGRPKGVMISHQGILRMAWAGGYAPIGPGDTVAHLSNVSFDAATWEIWGTLLRGARLSLFDRDEAISTELGALLRARGVTALIVTTALLHRLADDAPESFAGINHLLFGGEAVDAARVRRVLERGRPQRLLHMYGPAESVTYSSWHAVNAVPEGASTVPIGRAVDNLRLYVLDRHMNPAPVGVPGELYVAGEGIARGYRGSPGLTAGRFVPDPFSPEPGGRMYRTGDLTRWNADGVLEFVGRADHQVKIRGFRIEPGEIEAVLRERPSVIDAVVLVKGSGSEKRLVAYAVADGKTTGTTLRDELRVRLPEYMVPSAIVVMDRLPLTPNGKVDRAALPEPSLATSHGEHAAPRDAAEDAMASLFREVLGRERVGIHDNFFELGGHSLLATRLVSRVRATFGVEIPLRTFFESPTIASLARHVASGKGAAAPTRKAHEGGPSPLSYTQEGLWFLYRMQPQSSAYNITCTLEIEGDLDADVLEKALRTVVERHDALRTVFTETDNGVWQHAADASSFSLAKKNLLGALDPDSALASALHEETTRPFDLERGPIFRATLLRAHPDKHALVLAMHHIVSDGWSIAVITRELEEAYAAYLDGREPRLPKLALQYADHALAQREKLRGPALEALLSFWVDAIGPSPADLDLPVDGKRAPLGKARGGTQTIAIPPALEERMRRFCERASLTPYMFLLAVFQLLLQRYSGQDRFLLCTPVGNRPSPELEQIVGFFVNTVVLPADLRENPTFLELVRRAKDATIEALSRQELPFEKLVARLNPARDVRRNPLTQVMFILQNQATHEPHLGGLRARMVDPPTQSPKFDLTLGFVETENGFVGNFEYDADLFAQSTMEGMARAFIQLLDAVVESPTVRIGAIPLLAADERRIVLAERSVGPRVPLPSSPVHRLFEAQVTRAPGTTAVLAENAQASYAELNARANQIARKLRSQGVDRDVVVGICLDKSVDLYASLLGVWKAGGVYMPLHPDFPDARLHEMIEDSGARHVVTTGAYAARFHGVAHIDALDTLEDALLGLPAENLVIEPYPDNLAYVLYTSGSTGRPKGVMLPHRALSNIVPAIERLVAPRPEDRILQFAAISFDVSMFDILSALLFGATLVCGSKASTHPGSDLLAFVKRRAISILILTPSALAVTPVEDLPNLRVLAVGGEASHPELVTPWAKGRSLLNYYGPTETTVFSSIGTFVPGDRVVSIGPPLENETGFLLDRFGEPVPDGVPGELYIGGAGVGRGYLGRPGLTAERFVPDPFGPSGARMYRTGDRARRLPDGAMEYLGRLDQQVKIRGFRIEPGEIEAALRHFPGVDSAAVVLHGRQEGDRRLVAYVAGPNPPSDRDALRAFLAARLPEYMVPAAFTWLDRLPLNASGKLDRASLPEPTFGGEATLPRNATEEAIARIFREVLEREQVGIHDNFFRVGGHSLLATQVVSRIRKHLGVELPLASFFESPTIAGLAARIGPVVTLADATPVDASMRPSGRLEAPLSYAQEGLWFLHRLSPSSTAYNLPTVLHIEGALDVSALSRAFGTILERHEALRVILTDREGSPVQRVQDAGMFALAAQDLADHPGASLDEMIRREVTRPFDLERGPVFRALLVRAAPERHTLVLTMHHIVSDGWSLGVLLRDLGAAYEAHRAGRAPTLPPLPTSYLDHAVEQRERLAGPALEALLSATVASLGDAPTVIDWHRERRPLPAGEATMGVFGFSVPPALASRVRLLCEQEGVTPYILLCAIFQILLQRYSGEEQLLIGTAAANRGRPELEPLVGYFVGTLVLRGDLRQNPTFIELLRRTRETTLEALERQELPFDKLVERLNPRRDGLRNPLFQVMFLLQNQATPEIHVEGLVVRAGAAPAERAKFDLTLGFVEDEGALTGSLEYDLALFDAALAARMAGQYLHLLESALDAPNRCVASLLLLAPDERRALLEERSIGPTVPIPAPCVHRLFEEHAARAPTHTAILTEDECASYAELDARANRIARHLRDQGVHHESVVGVCLDKSVDLYASMLAVWKAGGVYLPLHPDFPDERLRTLIADSRANHVVTTLARAETFSGATHVTALDAIEERLRALPAEPLDTDLDALPDNLAYVIYTSGSTGRPKGVMIHHRALSNLALAIERTVAPRPTDRVLQFSSTSFDMSMFDILAALRFGATLVCGRKASMHPGPDLLAFVKRNAISIMKMTPSALAVMPHDTLPDLRVIAIGGEGCRPETVRPWAEGRLLLNWYGPTETTVTSSIGTFVPGDRLVSIGPPIQNESAIILDERLELVPDGMVGEMYLGGAGVGRGYLGQPGLTAERFVPDPFGPPGARMYRTGDRVRRSLDGAVEYLGRFDQQVKIRGYRIEPGEVEAALRAIAGVRHSVVRPLELQPGDKQLVAWVVLDAARHATLDSDALRTTLMAVLPSYMVPAFILVLDALPLTTSGKLDERALPNPDRGGSRAPASEPQTDDERVMCALWADALGASRVDPDDDFFQLGGHSLSAVMLAGRIERRFGREVPIAALFSAPTPRGLLQRMRAAEAPFSPLVHLGGAGTSAPIFWVHPIGGSVFSFKDVARHLGPTRPSYALQAFGLSAPHAPLDDVGVMAERYMEAILAERPEGPYTLVGYSMGGLIAFEIARRLSAAGKRAPLVVLLDTMSPAQHRAAAGIAEAHQVELFTNDFLRLMGEPAQKAPVQWEAFSQEQLLEASLALAQNLAPAAADIDLDRWSRLYRVFRGNLVAASHYEPGRFLGTLVYVRPSESINEPDGGFRELAADLLSVEVPGTHYDMLREPNAGEFAHTLASKLDAAGL